MGLACYGAPKNSSCAVAHLCYWSARKDTPLATGVLPQMGGRNARICAASARNETDVSGRCPPSQLRRLSPQAALLAIREDARAQSCKPRIHKPRS